MSISPAYHLRTNKAVERLLFVELLRKLDRRLPMPIESYRYVGLGGPYLEDFALIHGAFGNQRMTSLEVKEPVRTRQRINVSCSRIRLTLTSTETFVERYVTGKVPLIVWFDYEWPDWRQQLSESCELLQKLPPMSVFKITLTGKTDWLGGDGKGDPLAFRAEKLSSIFRDYGPFNPGQMNYQFICRTLHGICRRAIADAVPDTHERAVRTLASYEYNDGTPVLTITMIVGAISAMQGVIRRAGLREWPFALLNWEEPRQIDVPSLALRERLAVDRLLPDATARTVVKLLKLRLGSSYGESVKAMENYLEFYRYVPQFLRVSL